MIRAAYRDGEGRATIEQDANGRYFNNYPGHITAGPFETLSEAAGALKEHRPTAEQLNIMCGDCITQNCAGTCAQVWTGCIRKKR